MPLHYYGKVKKLLESLGIEDYDRVRIEKDGRYYEGILMPRPEILDDEHIIVKLDNGYNIGIHIDGAKVHLV
ncbi:MAG: Glu-tRNA(Gln) amidotransferase GatDE subunit D, partial [Thermoproteota archaeon]